MVMLVGVPKVLETSRVYKRALGQRSHVWINLETSNGAGIVLLIKLEHLNQELSKCAVKRFGY